MVVLRQARAERRLGPRPSRRSDVHCQTPPPERLQGRSCGPRWDTRRRYPWITVVARGSRTLQHRHALFKGRRAGIRAPLRHRAGMFDQLAYQLSMAEAWVYILRCADGSLLAQHDHQAHPITRLSPHGGVLPKTAPGATGEPGRYQNPRKTRANRCHVARGLPEEVLQIGAQLRALTANSKSWWPRFDSGSRHFRSPPQ